MAVGDPRRSRPFDDSWALPQPTDLVGRIRRELRDEIARLNRERKRIAAAITRFDAAAPPRRGRPPKAVSS